jgi:tripartite-type tricarboxylate transporter receptor subunit TctC
MEEMMIINRRSLALVLSSVVFALFAGAVAAQSDGPFPTKPIRIVVTLAAGGSNDVIARLLAQKLAEQLRQPVIVENKTGGNSIPGADFVARSAPDGHTLLFGNTTLLAIQVSLFAKLPYDPQRDFAPISVLSISPTILVVNPSVPARTVNELVALAKASPGKLNYASPGNGSPFHLSAELFKARTGTDLVHVPYKGNAPALVDLLSGRVQLMFANVLEVLPQITSGKLRPVALTGATRTALLPDVPTMAEAGLDNAEAISFFVLVAPRGTPKEVIATLNAETVKALARPDVRQRFVEFGVDPVGNSPEEAEIFLRNETAKWAKVVKDSGAKVDN